LMTNSKRPSARQLKRPASTNFTGSL
jgi:hypothetical protein